MVVARGLTKRYGDQRALDGVDFEVARGESVALWGSNGAGKTTALRVILGLVRYEGEVRLAGLDPRRDGRELRRRVGFVPQEPALQGDARVTETIAFFARLRRAPASRATELLAQMGLEGHAEHRIQELSGGLRQRLALALALVDDPPVLLLDEPTANLDAVARAEFYELLEGLRAEGRTLVFTSHRAEEVAFLADRVLQLERGRLVSSGPASELAADDLGTVELVLALAAGAAERARGLLESRGLAPHRLGDWLVVSVPAASKSKVLETLWRGGVEVEDFELRPARPRHGRDDHGSA